MEALSPLERAHELVLKAENIALDNDMHVLEAIESYNQAAALFKSQAKNLQHLSTRASLPFDSNTQKALTLLHKTYHKRAETLQAMLSNPEALPISLSKKTRGKIPSDAVKSHSSSTTKEISAAMKAGGVSSGEVRPRESEDSLNERKHTKDVVTVEGAFESLKDLESKLPVVANASIATETTAKVINLMHPTVKPTAAVNTNGSGLPPPHTGRNPVHHASPALSIATSAGEEGEGGGEHVIISHHYHQQQSHHNSSVVLKHKAVATAASPRGYSSSMSNSLAKPHLLQPAHTLVNANTASAGAPHHHSHHQHQMMASMMAESFCVVPRHTGIAPTSLPTAAPPGGAFRGPVHALQHQQQPRVKVELIEAFQQEIRRLLKVVNALTVENANLLTAKDEHRKEEAAAEQLTERLNAFQREYRARFTALKAAMVEFQRRQDRHNAMMRMQDSTVNVAESTMVLPNKSNSNSGGDLSRSTSEKLIQHAIELENAVKNLTAKLRAAETDSKAKDRKLADYAKLKKWYDDLKAAKQLKRGAGGGGAGSESVMSLASIAESAVTTVSTSAGFNKHNKHLGGMNNDEMDSTGLGYNSPIAVREDKLTSLTSASAAVGVGATATVPTTGLFVKRDASSTSHDSTSTSRQQRRVSLGGGGGGSVRSDESASPRKSPLVSAATAVASAAVTQHGTVTSPLLRPPPLDLAAPPTAIAPAVTMRTHTPPYAKHGSATLFMLDEDRLSDASSTNGTSFVPHPTSAITTMPAAGTGSVPAGSSGASTGGRRERFTTMNPHLAASLLPSQTSTGEAHAAFDTGAHYKGAGTPAPSSGGHMRTRSGAPMSTPQPPKINRGTPHHSPLTPAGPVFFAEHPTTPLSVKSHHSGGGGAASGRTASRTAGGAAGLASGGAHAAVTEDDDEEDAYVFAATSRR